MRTEAQLAREPRRSRPDGAALLIAVGGMLAVVAAGCGGSATAEKESLPGIKELGFTEEQYTAHIEKAQKAIAACMSAAGFEYVPVDVQTIQSAQERVRQDPGVTEQEYIQKYGFGVTTRFDNPVRDIGLGPNLKTWKGLPKAQQVAYENALYGDRSKEDFAFALDEENFASTGGCTRKAVEEVFTAEQVSGDYVNPKDLLIQSDKRVAEGRRNWAACMREAGHDYVADQDEIIDDFQSRLQELTQGADPATLTGERLAALKTLQDEERETALADLECSQKHVDKITRQVEVEVYGHVVR